MHIIADLQLHSKFSRAVSPQMTLSNIADWTRRKGIGLVATGDWTHPLWMKEIERDLEEMGNGLLKLKNQFSVFSSQLSDNGSTVSRLTGQQKTDNSPLFLLATEVSCIYSQGGKGRRVHTLIWVPTLDSARKINHEMTRQGCNLLSDGRPIIGLTSIQVAELVFTIEPKAMVIPAHAWTPWFSLFGSMSGFDSIAEAFGKYADQIYAVETGLSSNPAMNWQIKELDTRAIVSFSDAHSGPKLGREATVFDLIELSYEAIYKAITLSSVFSSQLSDNSQSVASHSDADEPKTGTLETENRKLRTDNRIAYTIEFFPEEGKYHFTGHRACNIRLNPGESKTKGTICPVCGKPLTQGVMQRVEELAGRSEADLQLSVIPSKLRASSRLPAGEAGQLSDKDPEIMMTQSAAFPNRPPFVMLVPLNEIISECIGSPVASSKVAVIYQKLTDALSGEFNVLLHTRHDDIARIAGERIAAAIDKVRRGDIHIDPGYDGVFGVVKIWKDGEAKPLVDAAKEQLSLL